MLKVEFHCHTTASPDSQVTPAQLVATGRARGLDRIVVTDHWSIAGALAAKEIDPELIIIGEEVLTDRGELLCAFVTEEIPRRTPFREVIATLRAQGAFISVSHPFDPRRSFWTPAELDELGTLVDAFETFNARNLLPRYNREAAEFSAKVGKPGTAGSDAHTVEELGRATMLLPDFTDGNGLRAVIGQAEFQTQSSGPWVRVRSRLARATRRFRKP